MLKSCMPSNGDAAVLHHDLSSSTLLPLPLVISVVYWSGDWFALPPLAHHKVVPFTGEQRDRRCCRHNIFVFITTITSYHQNHRRHHRRSSHAIGGHRCASLETCNGSEMCKRGEETERHDSSGAVLHHHQG